MGSEKKIKISSSFNVDAESLHQKITDHDTGKVKVIDKQEPHHFSQSTTITSNPVKYETKGTEPPKVTEGDSVELDPANVDDDASQL